jgi:hypothetical protein
MIQLVWQPRVTASLTPQSEAVHLFSASQVEMKVCSMRLTPSTEMDGGFGEGIDLAAHRRAHHRSMSWQLECSTMSSHLLI